MNYLQTLPPDVLRQTALSLSGKDVIKLLEDKDLNEILNNNFWEEKIKIDFSKYKGMKMVEDIRNEYIKQYIYQTHNKEVDMNNKLYEMKDDFEDLVRDGEYDNIIKFADKIKSLAKRGKDYKNDVEEAKNILYKLREKQGSNWPRYYESKPENPNEFDKYDDKIWYHGKWRREREVKDKIMEKFGVSGPGVDSVVYFQF